MRPQIHGFNTRNLRAKQPLLNDLRVIRPALQLSPQVLTTTVTGSPLILITILRLTLPLILFRESRELHIFYLSGGSHLPKGGKWEVGSGKWERQAGKKKLIELFVVVVVVVVSVQQSPPSQWISLRPRLSQFTGSKAVGLWRLSHGLKSAMCFSEVFESGPDGEWLWWGGGWVYLCCDRNGRVPRTGKGVVGPS
ncbi:hypothetical protein B296_00049898 [Ensete ventricosum]|uniref:Uncharacterized protein n=1 Tax=Ensete ventricosum TaxID=4639 RepID=A0A426XW75_ENSVE|nr:hypothetical protein B296_00049898 [Ensete ventricosum]